jgi:hypothetical protein
LPSAAVFAPDNAALTQNISDQAALKQFILDSLVGEALRVSDLKTRSSVKTLGGKELPVKVDGGAHADMGVTRNRLGSASCMPASSRVKKSQVAALIMPEARPLNCIRPCVPFG